MAKYIGTFFNEKFERETFYIEADSYEEAEDTMDIMIKVRTGSSHYGKRSIESLKKIDELEYINIKEAKDLYARKRGENYDLSRVRE